MRTEEKEGGRKGKERRLRRWRSHQQSFFRSFAKFVILVLLGFHRKGIRHLMSGGRTLSMFSFFRRGHLSDLDPYGAAQEWIYCKRRQKIKFFFFQCFVGTEVASEFGVCWVAVVFAEMEMAADAEESCLGKRQKAS